MLPDPNSQLERASRVLLVRLRSLGDCVLTTPAIRLLRLYRPDAAIGVVVEPRWQALFEGNPDISEILKPAVRSVRRFRPDLCIDLHGGNTASRLTLLSGARERAGFAHGRFRAIYSITIPRAQETLGVTRKVHTAEHVASAMFHLGVPQSDIPRAMLFADGPRFSSKPYAVIHPVAATPEKTWHADGFLRAAEYLRDHHHLDVHFIAGKGQDLSAFAQWSTFVARPLAETKALIAGASLFLGNDSGPAHMAAAFGVPPVVLFGPSDPVIWGPWKTAGEILHAPEGIHNIRIEQVTAALDRVKVAA